MLVDKTDQLVECLLSLAELKAVAKIKHLLTQENLRSIITLSKRHTDKVSVIAAKTVEEVFPVMMKDEEFPQFAAAYNKGNSKKDSLCTAYVNTLKDKYSKQVLEEMSKKDPEFKDVTVWELIMATKYMSKAKERK